MSNLDSRIQRAREKTESAISAVFAEYEPRLPENIMVNARDRAIAGLTPEQMKRCLEFIVRDYETR